MSSAAAIEAVETANQDKPAELGVRLAWTADERQQSQSSSGERIIKSGTVERERTAIGYHPPALKARLSELRTS